MEIHTEPRLSLFDLLQTVRISMTSPTRTRYIAVGIISLEVSLSETLYLSMTAMLDQHNRDNDSQ